MNVHCCNPTCAAVLRNSQGDPIELRPGQVVYQELLAGHGWDLINDSDGRPTPICGRCLRDE